MIDYSNTQEYTEDVNELKFEDGLESKLLEKPFAKYSNLFKKMSLGISHCYDFEIDVGIHIDLIKSMCTKEMSKSEKIKFNMDFDQLINDEDVMDYIDYTYEPTSQCLVCVLLLDKKINCGDLYLTLYNFTDSTKHFFWDLDSLNLGICGINLNGDHKDKNLLFTKTQISNIISYLKRGFDIFANDYITNSAFQKQYFLDAFERYFLYKSNKFE